VSENVGASTSRNPKGFYGLYRERSFVMDTLYVLCEVGTEILNITIISFDAVDS
jgi:hypothetical protein